jgi:chromosome segregation ATPase
VRKIEDILARSGEIQKAIKGLEDRIERKLKFEREQNEEKNSELNDRITELEEGTLKNLTQDLEQKLKRINEELKALKESLKKLQDADDQKNRKIENNEKEINEIKCFLNEMNAELSSQIKSCTTNETFQGFAFFSILI